MRLDTFKSRLLLALAALAITAPVALEARAEQKVLVELFTSQGCSSCPAADKLLAELAKDSSVITMSLPVDYWDYLGWKDTLADARFSARQKAYSHVRGDRDVYTPQMIVNGAANVIGNDRARIDLAIKDSGKAGKAMSVPVTMSLSGKQLTVSVATGTEVAPAQGEVWLCAITKAVPVSIGRGENRGREVVYHNVVRNVLKVGDFDGSPGSWTVPLDKVMREGIDAAAVLVQDGRSDKPGLMLGAAFKSLH